MSDTVHDPVSPRHYDDHPSGVSCITISEHFSFCTGSALKYLWRAGKKDPDKTVEDLEKAVWYINREILRIKCEEADRIVTIEDLMEECPGIVQDVTEDEIPPEWLAVKDTADNIPVTCMYPDYKPQKHIQMKASDLLPSVARRGGVIPGV